MKRLIKTLSLSSALFISLLTFSCSNFMSGSDSAEELKQKITYANAQSFAVTIAADRSEYGSLVSASSVGACKVTDTIPLEFSLAEGYKFLGWTAVCKNERSQSLLEFVQFEDAQKLKTSVKIINANDLIYSDELLLKPKVVPLLAITSNSTPSVENNAVAPRDVSPVLKFTAPLFRDNDFSGITISLSNPPEDGADYFRNPILQTDNKNLIIPANPDNRISVVKGTSRTVTIKIPAEITYETDEGNQTSETELTYTYTIDHTTSSKTNINYSFSDANNNTNLGNTTLVLDGQTNLTFTKEYNIGETATIALRIDPNYRFLNWTNLNQNAVIIQPVKNTVGENLYRGAEGYLDTENNIAYAYITVINSAEENVEIKANCELIPKNTIRLSFEDTEGHTNLGNTTLLLDGQSGLNFQKEYTIGETATVALRIDPAYRFLNWSISTSDAALLQPVKNSVGENLYKGAEGYLDTENNIAYAYITVINIAEETVEIKANCELIPKNTINLSFEDNEGHTNLGSTTLLLDGQSGLNFQKEYDVGDSFTVGCRIDEAYSFSEWNISDTEALTISPVKNNYGENLYSENNGFFDSSSRTAYAVITLRNKSESNVVNVKANCQLIPTVSVVFDGSQGRITPAETKTYKKGEKISVNFISDTDYYFTHWIIEQDGADITNRIKFHKEDGTVITEDSKITEAKEKSNIIISWNENTNSNIKIIPVCAERPQYLSNGPTGDDIYRDSKVQLMFDQNMDSGSIYYNTDEITNLINSLHISDSAFLTTTYNDTTQKYGYTYNGYVYFKNIEITNKTSGKSVLNHFNPPEIQGDTLIIKAKSGTSNAPPAFSQIVVKVSKDFYYSIPKTTNSETDFYKIPLSSSKKWSYSVNNSTDDIAPTFDIGINTTGGDTGFLKLKHTSSGSLTQQTPDQRSGNSNYSVSTTYRPTNTLANNTNYYTDDNKLYIYARVNDTGIGPSKDLTAFLYKIRDENYTDLTNGIYYTKSIPLNKSSSSLSLAGTAEAPYEVDISDLPSGFYKIVFKASDEVGNEKYSYRKYNTSNEPSDSYFYFYWVLIDKTGPVITNTSASSTDNSITFRWTPPAATDLNFSTYSLYNGSTQVTSNVVWKDSNGSTTTATDRNACSCTISGLTKATSYNYTIKTKDTYGNENTYNIPFNTLPNAPTLSSSTTSYNTTNSIRLSWTAPSSKATTKGSGGVKIYYSTSSSGPFTAYGSTFTTSPITISGLSQGTHYYFRAYYTDGYGSQSSTFYSADAYTLPGSVSNFRVTSTTKDTITVSWNAPSSGSVTGYRVYYKLSTASSYSVTNTTNTSYTLSGLSAGYKYNIYVIPYLNSTSIAGASSSTITQYTKPNEVYAASGKQFIESNSTSQYTINWTYPSSGFTGFHIYHSSQNDISTATYVDYWYPSHGTTSSSYTAPSLYGDGVNYVWLVSYIGTAPTLNQIKGTATTDGSLTNFTTSLITPNGIKTRNTKSAPTNLTIDTVTASYLQLSWTNPSSFDGVRIYYSSDNGSTYTYYTYTTNTYAYVYLNPATTYTIKLVPYMGNASLYSESIYSATITQATKCNPPTNLTVAETTSNSIKITWTAPSSGAGRGVIYGHCTTGNTADLTYDNWKYHSDSSTGFTISGLTPGTLYYIGVADWLDSGTDMTHVKGTNTNIRTASAVSWIAVYTKPYDPNFSLTSSSAGTIKVTLYAPSKGNYSGYYIFYGKNSECSGIGYSTYHQCVTSSTSTVTISGLSSNTSYRVWAIPYIGSTTGGYSVIKAIGSPSYAYWNYNYPYWGRDITTK